MRKKILLLFLILLFGITGAVIISGGDFLLVFSGLSYGVSETAPSGGDLSVGYSIIGQPVGMVSFSGGDYSIIGGVTGELISPYLRDDLSEVIVFPNPFKPGSGTEYDADGITFRNLTRRATIKIYNIAGELVKTIEVDSIAGEVKWNADNDLGEEVASGVYIYYISAPGVPKAKGMISIVK